MPKYKHELFEENPCRYWEVTFKSYGGYDLWYINNSTVNSMLDCCWYANLYKNDENGVDIQIRRTNQTNLRVEFMYQVIFEHKWNMRKKKIIRGIIKSDCQWFMYSESLKISKFFITGFCALGYNLWNFQAVSYTIIDRDSIRRVNFKQILFGESKIVYANQNGLYVPMKFVRERASKLALKICKDHMSNRLQISLELLLQIMHGVRIQLEEKKVKPLLKLSVKYQVLNVERYCEKQLIQRDDFTFSEKRKFKMACKHNLNILMNQLLTRGFTLESLWELAENLPKC